MFQRNQRVLTFSGLLWGSPGLGLGMEAAVSSSSGYSDSSDKKPAAREVIDLAASSDDEGEPSAKRQATESSVSASLDLPLLPFYLGAVSSLVVLHLV